MNARWMLTAALAVGMFGICGCAKSQGQGSSGARPMTRTPEADEPGETKISLDQAPPAARQTIQRELAGAELEDIAKKQRNGKTIYETDIIKGSEKWEVVVAEDGSILSKAKEGSAKEREADAEEGEAKTAG